MSSSDSKELRDSIDNGLGTRRLGSESKPKAMAKCPAKPKGKRVEVDPKRNELKATNRKLQVMLRSLKLSCDRVQAYTDTVRDSVPRMESEFMQSKVQEVLKEIDAARALYAAEVVEKDEIDVEKLSDVQGRVANVIKARRLIFMTHTVLKTSIKKHIIDISTG